MYPIVQAKSPTDGTEIQDNNLHLICFAEVFNNPVCSSTQLKLLRDTQSADNSKTKTINSKKVRKWPYHPEGSEDETQ